MLKIFFFFAFKNLIQIQRSVLHFYSLNLGPRGRSGALGAVPTGGEAACGGGGQEPAWGPAPAASPS